MYECIVGYIRTIKMEKKMNKKYKLLNEISEIITGMPEVKKGDNKKLYKYFCIQPSSLNINNEEIVDFIEIEKEKPIDENIKIKKGDILIKRIGPTFVYLATYDYKNTCVTSNIILIRPKDNIISEYLAAYLEIQGLKTLKHYTQKGVTIHSISKKELSIIKIPILDKKEQEILGKYWFLKKHKTNLLNKLIVMENNLAKSLFNKILTKKEVI